MMLSHLRSASVCSFSPAFRGWGGRRGKAVAVDGSDIDRELQLEQAQRLDCPLLPRSY